MLNIAIIWNLLFYVLCPAPLCEWAGHNLALLIINLQPSFDFWILFLTSHPLLQLSWLILITVNKPLHYCTSIANFLIAVVLCSSPWDPFTGAESALPFWPFSGGLLPGTGVEALTLEPPQPIFSALSVDSDTTVCIEITLFQWPAGCAHRAHYVIVMGVACWSVRAWSFDPLPTRSILLTCVSHGAVGQRWGEFRRRELDKSCSTNLFFFSNIPTKVSVWSHQALSTD